MNWNCKLVSWIKNSTSSPYEEKARHTVPAAGSPAALERERPESGRGGRGDYGPFNVYLACQP